MLIHEDEKSLLKLLNENGVKDSKFTEILTNTSKSLYRLNVINEEFTRVLKKSEEYSQNICLSLSYLFYKSIQLCGFVSDEYVPIISIVKKENGFDYQNCDSMKLSKVMTGPKKTPLEISKLIIENIPENDIIEHLEVSGVGFINIRIKSEYITRYCCNFITKGVSPPFVKRRKVVVDFSSPNIAKEMHVGHLRSTIIGDAICRILEYVGFEVLRVNHIGDWGTQFGMLIAHLEDTFPDYLQKLPPISDLQVFYKESKKRFDEDPEFKKKAYLKVTQLQGGEPHVRKAWNIICDISRKDFQRIYDRLDIKLTEMGESFYQSRMVELVKHFKEKKITKEDNGCQIVFIPGFKVPYFIVKSDGGFTYDTSDITTIRYRLFEEKADWILYVVDSGQSEHLESLFKLASFVGWINPDLHRVQHIQFGVVLGEDKKKFKSRSGDTVKLSLLLDESVSRSLAKLKARGSEEVFSQGELEHIAESIGYSCIKYADLSKNMTSTYEFSFDRMLDDRGNTAVYLLYIYTRIRSIIRKAGHSEESIVNYVSTNGLICESPEELKLLRKIIHFPEIIYKIVFDTYPHYLCEYLYELSCSATEYYDKCQIVYAVGEGENKVNMNRLAQMYVTSIVLKKGFDLLGIKTLERM